MKSVSNLKKNPAVVFNFCCGQDCKLSVHPRRVTGIK